MICFVVVIMSSTKNASERGAVIYYQHTNFEEEEKMKEQKITYKKLMQEVEEGTIQINAWERNGDAVDVTVYKNDRPVRKIMIVTGKRD